MASKPSERTRTIDELVAPWFAWPRSSESARGIRAFYVVRGRMTGLIGMFGRNIWSSASPRVDGTLPSADATPTYSYSQLKLAQTGAERSDAMHRIAGVSEWFVVSVSLRKHSNLIFLHILIRDEKRKERKAWLGQLEIFGDTSIWSEALELRAPRKADTKHRGTPCGWHERKAGATQGYKRERGG